jgi:nucleotide-binding universal stress UspA family protein
VTTPNPSLPNRWLVGNDGSAHGHAALCTGERLAALHRGELAQVIVTPVALPGRQPEPVPQVRDTSVMIRRVGVPGVEIARCADEWKADVVLLGRGGEAPRRTTATVLRRCRRPVLMVPEGALPFRRILFALDGTERGLRILDRGAEFAAVFDAVPGALCVLPSREPEVLPGASAPRDRRALVEGAMDRCPELGGRSVLAVRRGEPVPEILAHLEESGGDLLVLGLRQGGPGSDPGSGHVARDLLRVAPVAILTVPI